MLLGSCHLHEEDFYSWSEMDGHELDLDVGLPDPTCSYMKQFYQSHSVLFCWCNSPLQSSILKWPWTILDGVLSENPALVLFVHTQNRGPHDIIKILMDFQFKKKPMAEGENILLFACLLFDSFFLLTSAVASLWVKWCICRGACAAFCFRIPFHIFGWHIYTAYNLSYIVVIS